MRTAIFLGLTAIADALSKTWLSDDSKPIALLFLVAFIVMDLIELSKK